ncbi:hypothetical protein NKI50_08495 [Mesorhizobium sp. M0563]|uniref:hypothetical protein n=1 Tax=Mesorhizobium sp. M0563 TaxID=2956959 RepID=UPI00333933D2
MSIFDDFRALPWPVDIGGRVLRCSMFAAITERVKLIRSIAASGTGVSLVTHDLATVRALADRIVVLSLGRVAYDGSARHLSADQLWGLMASGTLASAGQ